MLLGTLTVLLIFPIRLFQENIALHCKCISHIKKSLQNPNFTVLGLLQRFFETKNIEISQIESSQNIPPEFSGRKVLLSFINELIPDLFKMLYYNPQPTVQNWVQLNIEIMKIFIFIANFSQNEENEKGNVKETENETKEKEKEQKENENKEKEENQNGKERERKSFFDIFVPFLLWNIELDPNCGPLHQSSLQVIGRYLQTHPR